MSAFLLSLPKTSGTPTSELGRVGCELFFSTPSIKSNSGFVEVVERYKIQPGVYEFILRPNSTGKIVMDYDFGTNNPDELGISDVLKPHEGQWALNGTKDLTYLSANQTGLAVIPKEIGRFDGNVVRIEYTIDAAASAVKGTYLVSLYQTCPGELITIGDNAYSERLPWS